MSKTPLDDYKDETCYVEKEWQISIQTPSLAVDDFAKALGDNIPLIQGHYTHCMYIQDNGRCRFKGGEGAHSGLEDTVQEVPSSDVIISIPQDPSQLKQVLKIINKYHVHEEPTVRITETFGLRSLYNSDADNPNKYWNRDDSEKIHGSSLT